MANKKKVTTAVVAGVTAVALLLGGTFAWQSINQTALNEKADVVNPGGRLHDDFDGSNKDVYVENFADEAIFARVRLEEFFEITQAGDTVHKIAGERDEEGNVERYDLHYFDGENATDAYWDWTTGGSTVFMPTFNKNKDSLVADVNGTYEGPDGGVTNAADDDRYTDYVEYYLNQKVSDNAIYDYDSNDDDEVGNDFDNWENYPDNVTAVYEEHIAQNTLGATLMSMQEWIDEGMNPGEYWVYDTDGWVYWAQEIQPNTATGLLLDGISLNQVMDDSWYYAINVVAQFVTADDLGKTDGTGFYDTEAGTEPSADALALLKAIGVDVSGDSSEGESAGNDDEEGSYEYISFYLYADGDTTHDAHYVQPNEEYEIHLEIDEYSLSVLSEDESITDEKYTPEFVVSLITMDDEECTLTEGDDYTISDVTAFGKYYNENTDEYLYTASAEITLSDETTIPYASTITIEAFSGDVFEGWGSYVVTDEIIQEDDIHIYFYDSDKKEVTADDEASITPVKEKEQYYVAVSIDYNDQEYVVYDPQELNGGPDPSISKIVAIDSSWVFTDYEDYQLEFRNFDLDFDTGILTVGTDDDPSEDWYEYNKNPYVDDLRIRAGAEDVVLKIDGETKHLYFYKERYFCFEGEILIQLEIAGDEEAGIFRNENDEICVTVAEGESKEVPIEVGVETDVSNLYFDVDLENDTDTKIIIKKIKNTVVDEEGNQVLEEQEVPYLVIGAKETAERIIVVTTNTEKTHKGSMSVQIIRE